MADSLIDNPPTCVATLRRCPPSPVEVSAMAGMRSRSTLAPSALRFLLRDVTFMRTSINLEWCLLVTKDGNLLKIDWQKGCY